MTLELLKSFEEFVDARKAGFLHVKNFVENGGHLVGMFCSYTPLELFDAAGVAVVGLCGTSNEPIADAEKVLPKNLCPLIKSSYGFAYTDKCPYTYFCDFIVGETTCDGKKKMFELLNEIKETYVIHLPQSQKRSYAKEIWYQEVKLLKEKLEEKYGVIITDEKLREATRKRNELRKTQMELYSLQGATPPIMKASEVMSTLAQGVFNSITISSMCTVFAESEVISLIGKGTPREDIAFGIIESVVTKVSSLLAQVPGDTYFLTGGLCDDAYIVERLSLALQAPVKTTPLARYAGAIGGALLGGE